MRHDKASWSQEWQQFHQDKKKGKELIWDYVMLMAFQAGYSNLSTYFIYSFPTFTQHLHKIGVGTPDLVASSSPTLASVVWLQFVGAVALAPFLEENLFRGIMLNRTHQYHSYDFAVIFSAFCFSILHKENTVIFAFFFGIMTAWMYIRHQNILYSIILHLCNNLTVSGLDLIDFYQHSASTGSTAPTQSELSGFALRGTVFLAISLGYWIHYIVVTKRQIKARDSESAPTIAK